MADVGTRQLPITDLPIRGITAIATAVRSGAKFHGAVNLAVLTARFTPSRDADFREALRRAAQIIANEISREL